jgi:hypothetical protein
VNPDVSEQQSPRHTPKATPRRTGCPWTWLERNIGFQVAMRLRTLNPSSHGVRSERRSECSGSDFDQLGAYLSAFNRAHHKATSADRTLRQNSFSRILRFRRTRLSRGVQ